MGMHGRSFVRGQDIEVELTEVFLTTNRRSCHAGTDIFRRPQINDFMELLVMKAKDYQLEEYLPMVPGEPDEETREIREV